MLETAMKDSQSSVMDGLSKDLKNFLERTYKYFLNQDMDISHISQKTYEFIINKMQDMTKKYSLNNIEVWIKGKIPARLYYLDSCDKNQFDFYDDIRSLMYNIKKMENNGNIDCKVTSKIEKTQNFYQQIGTYLECFYKSESQKPQSKVERSDLSLTELKNLLKVLKKEEEGAYSKTHIEVLNEILDTEGKLLKIYKEDIQKYGTSIRQLKTDIECYQKKKIHDLVSNNHDNYWADYLKISIEENSSRMLLGQSEEMQNMYERGCRIYQEKKEKLLNDIVKELLEADI